jgi:hypothetical protein
MNKPTLSIDLGAAYTKVAYREPLTREGPRTCARANTEIVFLKSKDFLIPSLMILTGRSRDPWCAGYDALNLTPSENMAVFSNWKTDFFSNAPDRDAPQLRLVAGCFFKWLRKELNKCAIPIDDTYLVRVSVPALDGIERQKNELVACMVENGWPKNVIKLVDEPKSNLLGVLSEGRNVVTAFGEINYSSTFGQGAAWDVINAMKQVALNVINSRSMRISVVDLGSFTLDVATLTVDLNVVQYSKFPIQEVCAKSWRIGVSTDIDRQCFPKLYQRHGVNEDLLTQYEKESAKVELYAGRPYALKYGRVVLGQSVDDQQDINDSIAMYCNKVCKRIADNCADSEFVVLTGGGMCIPDVQKTICKRLMKKNKRILYFQKNGATRQTHHRDSSVVGLGRSATALGGASIGLGFDPDQCCLRFFDRGTPL